MKKITILLYLCLVFTATVKAQNKAEADSAYSKEMYDEAILIYMKLLEKGASADIYYNIGNCFYKKDNIAQAILNYERAALLNPGDANIRFNLDLARSKTIDKIVPKNELFLVTWYRTLINYASVDGWAYIAMISFWIMLLCIGLFLFTHYTLIKKISFFITLLLFIIMLCANLFAYRQSLAVTNRMGAIVIASSVVVKSTPNESGTDLFILHEGTRIDIIDDTMKDWKEIRLADGKIGWMHKDQLEVI